MGQKGHRASNFPEENKKYDKKEKIYDDKYRASRSRKSRRYDIGNLKGQIKKTFTTLEANIDKLGDEDSNLTSYEIEYSSGNSHLQFNNKPASFTGTNNFNTDPEDSIKIPGVTNPTGVVLQKVFKIGI